MTPHNEANKEDIAKIVIMPGDPLRAEYIAKNFLDDAKLVNKVRGMYAYTGFYKGKRITVMAHGMGVPSIGIYSYELFKFYDVDSIIRIGSCGAYIPELNLFDIILSEKVHSESNYAYSFHNDPCHLVEASSELNEIIRQTAKEQNISLHIGNTLTLEAFDPYMDNMNHILERLPNDFQPLSGEMEAFGLFYNAKLLGKKAACLMSVVDSHFITNIATPEERQTGLNTMIQLALDSTLKM